MEDCLFPKSNDRQVCSGAFRQINRMSVILRFSLHHFYTFFYKSNYCKGFIPQNVQPAKLFHSTFLSNLPKKQIIVTIFVELLQ